MTPYSHRSFALPGASALWLLFTLALHAQTGAKLWDFVTPASILASPTIGADGRVYLGSYDRKIYALAAGGDILWVTTLPPPEYIYFATYAGVYGTPAVGADGTVYIPSENGKLLALDPADGGVKWTFSTPQVEGLYSSPAIGPDGTIYFGSYDNNVYAILPNGSRKWSSRLGSTIFASPAVGLDGTVYCGADDGVLYALDPADGSREWTFNTGSYSITASPAIAADGTLYLGVGSMFNPKFYSISPQGTTNWIFTTGNRVRSSAAIAPDGTIYFGCDDGKLYALNPDGTQRWAFPAGNPVGSSPAIAADGTVYFGCDDGKLYAVDPEGNALWSFPTGNDIFASPAVGPDGSIYLASTDGRLTVLRGCSPPAVAAWPMFRQDMARTGRAASPTTNRPPALEPISDQVVAIGQTLAFTTSAADPDSGQELTFSLAFGPPVGATIDAATGSFQWSPSGENAVGPYSITMVVTDNGTPPLSDVRCFGVNVTATALDVELTVTVNHAAWGTVSPASGTYPAGSLVQLVAIPAAYFQFTGWSGNASGTNNPLTLTLDSDIRAEAIFAEVLTSEHPTPHWWLAAHGTTNDFEAAVTTIGANGIPLWQSYIAGLDPDDPESQFRFWAVLAADDLGHVLNWTPVTDRVYSLLSSTGVSNGFAPVPGASNLPSTIQSFTNVAGPESLPRFYHMEVRIQSSSD